MTRSLTRFFFFILHVLKFIMVGGPDRVHGGGNTWLGATHLSAHHDGEISFLFQIFNPWDEATHILSGLFFLSSLWNIFTDTLKVCFNLLGDSKASWVEVNTLSVQIWGVREVAACVPEGSQFCLRWTPSLYIHSLTSLKFQIWVRIHIWLFGFCTLVYFLRASISLN